MAEYELEEADKRIDELPSARDILSSLSAGDSVSNTPIFHKNLVIFGAMNGFLYAVSKEGALSWRFRTGGPIVWGPATFEERVYVGSFDGFFYCLNGDDGDLVWKFHVGDKVTSGPIIADGKVYFGALNGYLYCLSLDGQELWKFKTGDAVLEPVVVNGRIYAPSADKRLYCVEDGKEVWRYLTGGYVAQPTVVTLDGRELVGFRESRKSSYVPIQEKFMIVFASWDGYVYALRPEGSPVWKSYLGDIFDIGNCSASGGLIFVSGSDRLIALSPKTGDIKWKFKMGGQTVMPARVRDGIVYFGSYDKNLYAVNMQGDLLWRFQTGGIVIAPATDNENIYFGSWDGFMRCINIKEQKVLWQFSVGKKEAGMEFVSFFDKISRIKRKLQQLWKPETPKLSYDTGVQAGFHTEGFGAKGYKTGAPGAYKGSDAVGEYVAGRKRKKDEWV